MAVCPREDREQFIRDNAVSLVYERDVLIERLRTQVRKLHMTVKSLRELLAKLSHGRGM